jgi:hypothetical protein
MQDILNKKFNRWLVVSYEGKMNTERHWYKVKCDCGNESIVERNILKRCKTTQCRSCARKKWAKSNKNPMQKHGFSSPSHSYYHVYNAWLSMKGRCLRKSDTSYKRYGKKGIQVCERWLNSFDNFLEDMGLPAKGNSLDRIDVNGNYCKENCRWANKETQSNNCRRNIYYEHTGIKLSETQWARKLGISRNKLMWWARKRGIQWVIHNIEKIKQINKGMSDKEYQSLDLELPSKLYRKIK